MEAKQETARVYWEIHRIISDSLLLLEGHPDVKGQGLISAEQLKLLENYLSKAKGIFEILQRNCLKVVFVGRTSNGKSTVINAMLKNKILPSGIGHTTNCFVQVEGTDSDEAYIVTEDAPTEKRSIQCLSRLVNAVSVGRLNANVRIGWPKNRSSFLKEGIIFVDSPGIDVSPDIDKWIDEYCLDADVFVLVVNATATVMKTERDFFHRLSSRLSNPNIFILNNHWDRSAMEPEYSEEARQRLMERCVAFLTKELRVVESPLEAQDRVFFISAKEVLLTALANSGEIQASTRLFPLDNFQTRLLEFTKFEDTLRDHVWLRQESKLVEEAKVMAITLQSVWRKIVEDANERRRSIIRKKCEERLNSALNEVRTSDISKTKLLAASTHHDCPICPLNSWMTKIMRSFTLMLASTKLLLLSALIFVAILFTVDGVSGLSAVIFSTVICAFVYAYDPTNQTKIGQDVFLKHIHPDVVPVSQQLKHQVHRELDKSLKVALDSLNLVSGSEVDELVSAVGKLDAMQHGASSITTRINALISKLQTSS